MVDLSVDVRIEGSDIDPEMIRLAEQNARLAGISHMIQFEQKDVGELSHEGKYGFIITNPPYGERLEEKLQSRLCTGSWASGFKVSTHGRST